MRISDWSSDVCSSDLPLTTPDDVRFLDHLIDDAIATFGVDPHRIYMGGYSGGAMMTLRYACEVPGRIAGTALVGAQMITTLAAKCDTSAPPAMMFIDGDEDPLASYDANATLMIPEDRRVGKEGCRT